MEVVNVKNVIIKYIPEHIVVETYVLSNNSHSTDAGLQRTNTKNKSNDGNYNCNSNEPLDEIYYISMDESLNPDSDAENNYEASSTKDFTEEEYLEVEDDVQELFVESDQDIDDAEFVELGSQEAIGRRKNGSTQVLKDWFFDHLHVILHTSSRVVSPIYYKCSLFFRIRILQSRRNNNLKSC